MDFFRTTGPGLHYTSTGNKFKNGHFVRINEDLVSSMEECAANFNRSTA